MRPDLGGWLRAACRQRLQLAVSAAGELLNDRAGQDALAVRLLAEPIPERREITRKR